MGLYEPDSARGEFSMSGLLRLADEPSGQHRAHSGLSRPGASSAATPRGSSAHRRLPMDITTTQFFGNPCARRKERPVTETTGTWTRFRTPRANIAPPRVEEEPAAAADSSGRPRSGTFIEVGAMFEGTLTLSGDFRIDNEFRGVLSTDGTVVVGPNGSIEGDIIARQVEIEGAVVGNISARRMCVVRSTGRLHGDIETACIEIEPHAFFQGGTRMIQPIAQAASKTIQPATA